MQMSISASRPANRRGSNSTFRRALLPLAAAALLSAGCSGDDGDLNDGGSTGPGGTTTSEPQDSTRGSSSTGSSFTGTTTGPEGTSSSTGEGSSSDGMESTGDQPGSGYGDCRDDATVCAPGEICMQLGALGAVCAEQGCDTPEDCDVPRTGDAPPACDDVNGNFSIDCYLDCSAGEMCPDGMSCAIDTVCIWPATAPGGGECPDEDLGNTVPQMIMGDNTGLFNDVIQSCVAGSGGADSLYLFTAPADGTYQFDTAGTSFDTGLSLLDGCDGAEIACNDDDAPMVLTSALEIDMTMDQSVIIVVDSYGGNVGPFNLNITQVMR